MKVYVRDNAWAGWNKDAEDSIERVAGHFRSDTPNFLLSKLGGCSHAMRWWTGPDR